MMRVTTKPFVAGAIAMLLGASALSTPATAYPRRIDEQLYKPYNITRIQLTDDVTRMDWIVYLSADGKLMEIEIINSNSEDNTTGKGSHTDKPDVEQMIRDGLMTFTTPVAPDDVPQLIAHIEGKLGRGGGLGPRYHPSDDDNGPGHGDAPTHSMEVKKTPDEIREEIAAANAAARTLATLGISMGDGDEGGGESASGFNQDGSPGGNGDADGDYTEGQNKDIGSTEKSLVGPKPELVNPPHLDRTGVGGHGHATGGAGGAGGAGGGGVGGGHSAMSTHS